MTKKPNEKQFSAICFLVLMNHHGEGIEAAHLNYIEEKLVLLTSGYDAWGYLDSNNKAKVIRLIKKWGYDIPDEIM